MENSKKTKEDFEQLFEKALNMIQWTKKSEGTQERALYILLYYVSSRLTKKWHRPRSWTKVITNLALTYPERLGLE